MPVKTNSFYAKIPRPVSERTGHGIRKYMKYIANSLVLHYYFMGKLALVGAYFEKINTIR
jgi:hypothetical protein